MVLIYAKRRIINHRLIAATFAWNKIVQFRGIISFPFTKYDWNLFTSFEQLSLLDFPGKIKMREREKERERIAYVVSIKFFLPGSARSLILLENENCEYKMIRGELQTDTNRIKNRRKIETLSDNPTIEYCGCYIAWKKKKKKKKRC